MEATWEIFDGELPNGKEVTVYYDHKTTLTVVPNYAVGRTLIFNDADLNNDELAEDTIVSCIVKNSLLDSKTPEEIFNEAKSK